MFLNNRFFVIITWLFFCVALTGATGSGEIPDDIADSFNKGHSRNLARHFNSNIELVVLDNEDVYSKSQAELIMREFFSAHKPVKFTYLHKGGKESSRYAIGNLETETGNFRIYFLLKISNGIPLIHLLRIEETEDTV